MRTLDRAPALLRLRRALRFDALLPNLTAGLLVGFLAVILSVSLATLVYAGPLGAYLANGIGLALIGTLVVCIAVGAFSSLPGMIACTQNVPAAVLAVVAAGVVTALPAGATPLTAFMTVTAASALATLAVGTAFYLLGALRLGRLVRYLPYPVVGGFLAGTGWLLVTGAVGVMAGVPPTLGSVPELFVPATAVAWLPGLALAVLLTVATQRSRHYLVLPTVLAAAAIATYAVMFATKGTPDLWRERGLLLGPFPDASLLEPFRYADLAVVHWPAVAAHAAGIATIVFVSLLALLLNATGLELATRRRIDLNRELRVNGIGNLLTGAAGGMISYPGIGLNLLAQRLGTGSRLASAVTAGVVALTLAVGASTLAYVPTVIVGGLLAHLGLGLLHEWAVQTRARLDALEYGILLVIFVVIVALGFPYGVGLGVVAALALFVVNYSRAEVVKHALDAATYRSRVVRTPRERQHLQEHGRDVLVLQLQGYLFFGTANALLERIEAQLDSTPSARIAILDFRHVEGVDATALLGFAKLAQLAGDRHVTLAFSDLAPGVARSLTNAGILTTDRAATRSFPNLDAALDWSETRLLETLGTTSDHEPFLASFTRALGSEPAAGRLLSYLERIDFEAGSSLMRQGDPPDVLYFLERGTVTVTLEPSDGTPVRLETMHAGGVVGELGFYTGGPRGASVLADEPTTAYRLTRDALERLTRDDPELAARFHTHVVRLLAERVTHLVRVVEALQR